jgi:hypothetical protein
VAQPYTKQDIHFGTIFFKEIMPETVTFTPAQESMQLWSITGRCFGDDEDSSGLLWGRSEADATRVFQEQCLDMTDEEINEPENSNKDPSHFIIIIELIGEVTNGEFVLNRVHLDLLNSSTERVGESD